MSTLLILILVAVYFFFMKGKTTAASARGRSLGGLDLSNPTTLGLIILAIFLFGKKLLNGVMSFLGGNTYTEVPSTQVNSCGCQAGQLVLTKFKPFIGRTRWNNMTCSNALALVSSKPNRASIVGCVNV